MEKRGDGRPRAPREKERDPERVSAQHLRAVASIARSPKGVVEFGACARGRALAQRLLATA